MEHPYILYTPDKNRTSQRFKRNKTAQIVEDMERFFDAYTNVDVNRPYSLVLSINTSLDGSNPTDEIIQVIRTTTQRWGSSEVAPVAHHYPSGRPSKSLRHQWKVDGNKFREVVEYVSSVPTKLASLELLVSYRFKLVDPLTKIELPFQDNVSSFLIWLSGTKAISPMVYFPFGKCDDSFWRFIDGISVLLPFNLEEKYLRSAFPNKAGEIATLRKVQR
jgi:hypothetical protein